jgi:hypothetical protein
VGLVDEGVLVGAVVGSAAVPQATASVAIIPTRLQSPVFKGTGMRMGPPHHLPDMGQS